MKILLGLALVSVLSLANVCPPMACDDGSECGAGFPPCGREVVCSATAGAKDCRGKAEYEECTALGPHGGKMDGECVAREGDICGCRPVF